MYKLVKQFEGCRLEAYSCSKGYPTIGWGNRFYPNGEEVELGDKIEQEYADEIFEDYYVRKVTPLVDAYKWLNTAQREALGSLIYNCGPNFTKRNPSLHRALKQRDYTSIHREWNFGIRDKLFTRRTEECARFFQYPYK